MRLMTPATFPEANTKFGPHPDLSEEQCHTTPAFLGKVEQGSVDGANLVIVAWQPSLTDIERICDGGPIFLTCIGGLPPHFLSTDFQTALHPS
jgi:hypothetical protein